MSAEAQRVAYHSARLGVQRSRSCECADEEVRQLRDDALAKSRLAGVVGPKHDVPQCLYGRVRHAWRGDQDQLDHGQVVVLDGGEQRLELEVGVRVAVCPATERRRTDVMDS